MAFIYPTVTGREALTLIQKAQFNIATYAPTMLAEDELMMMTIRSHDQFNTTIYGLDDRYRGIYNERRVILMNQADMNKQNLREGDIVDLLNDEDGRQRIAHKFIVVLFPYPVVARPLISPKPMCWYQLTVWRRKAIRRYLNW